MSWDGSACRALPPTRVWERSRSLHMLEQCGPKAVALYHYWNARRGARAMPGRADIDPMEMRQWLPRITLVDVAPDGGFTYRLVGTRIVDLLGMDPTGRPIDWSWPEGSATSLLDSYREVVETRAPVICHQVCEWRDDDEPSAWALRLPLSSGGSEVDMVLGYLSDNIGMLSQL